MLRNVSSEERGEQTKYSPISSAKIAKQSAKKFESWCKTKHDNFNIWMQVCYAHWIHCKSLLLDVQLLVALTELRKNTQNFIFAWKIHTKFCLHKNQCKILLARGLSIQQLSALVKQLCKFGNISKSPFCIRLSKRASFFLNASIFLLSQKR